MSLHMGIRMQGLTMMLLLALLCFTFCDAETVKICVPYPDGDSSSFRGKCTRAVGLANTKNLTFECVDGGSPDECVEQIQSGEAHLTSLDASDVISANNDHGVLPLIVEKAGNDVPGGTYYAVAVVNKEFCGPTTELADLKGVSSCHTGYRKTAGWKMPVGTLLSSVEEFATRPRLSSVEDDAELVAEFFDSVCAPRASGNGPMNSADGDGRTWPELCSGCKGDCTTNDQYYDYPGAFRCLMEGSGDVAFIKHTTVLDYAADGELDEVHRAWATKEKDEFQLLCRSGGCKDVTDFKDCHLSLVPGHALVTSKELGYLGDDSEMGLAIQAAILEAAEETDFLNRTTALARNFLWSDSTTSLEAVNRGMDDYLTVESQETFIAFGQLSSAVERAGPPGAVYCATSEEELEFCEEMVEIVNGLETDFDWGCVQKDSKRECMEAIEEEEADWMTVSPPDAYTAHSQYGLTAIVAEDGDLGDGYDYYSVAVVHKEFCNTGTQLIDLKGKNSCHSGYRRNAGWDMPVGRLLSLGIMEPVREDPLIENDAESAASFFADSCAPIRDGQGPKRGENGTGGEWAPLCSGCKDSCGEDSPYFSYQGAHRCLADGAGDVAFVKHTTAFLFDDEAARADLRLICPGRTECAAVDDYEDCNLGRVAARSVVVRSSAIYTIDFKSTLLAIVANENVTDLVLNEKSNPESHIFRPTTAFVELENGTEAFLGSTFAVYEALEATAAPRGEVVKICVPHKTTNTDLQKCEDIFAAANVTGITFECIAGGSTEACMLQLFEGEAHLTALDGGDVFRAHHLYGLVPLLREIGPDGKEGTYFSVAIVNSDFCENSTTLADLQGVRSCHTGYRKMAGWRVPVGTLLAEVEAFNATASKRGIEDDAELVAKFFNQSCAPRISGNGPQNTANGEGSLWEDICTGCKGDCTTNDQYYDYPGAFRCLMEGKGDVAFVKHTTVPDYASDGKLDEVLRAWATKPSSDFKLLCRSGGCEDVEEYRDCHLALVPSHAIVGAAALGEKGSLFDIGRAVQEGIVAAADIPEFFDAAREFIANFPFSPSSVSLVAVDDGYEGYITPEANTALNTFAELIDGERRTNPGDLATFCASTPEQLEACEKNVEEIYSKIEPDYSWACRKESSVEACYDSLKKGTSQFMAASPDEALKGSASYKLDAILAEAVGSKNQTVVYSIVAVDAATCDNRIFFTDFEGEDVCFPNFGSEAGWETPLSIMISQGFLSSVKNSKEPSGAVQSASDFFGKMCAPHDPESASASETLCEACEDECGMDGGFVGPSGAVECLKTLKGGIAVTDNTILLMNEETTEDLQLLCPNKRGCHDVDSFETCNFGITPTDVILVSESEDSAYISRLRSVLIEASTNGKSYASILKNTRDSGELVALIGSTDFHLSRYAFTKQILTSFEADS